MSDINHFNLTELNSMNKLTQNCLEEMKHYCEKELPFHLSDVFESTTYVSEDCIKKMKYCCELATKLARLESYKKSRSITKVMLLLTEYGSEDSFKIKIESAISKFSRRLKDLEGYVEKIETASLKRGFLCTTCKGTGEITRFRAVRERGSRPYSVSEVTPCGLCEGSGLIPVGEELLESVTLFLEKAKKILEAMVKFYQSLKDFTSTCFTRMQTMAYSQKTLETEPIQRKPRTIVTQNLGIMKKIHEEMLKPRKTSWPYPKEYFLNLLNIKRVISYYSPAPNGTPTWWERRANRQYVCSVCGVFIYKGEKYIGRRKLRPGMRGPYGYRGTYVTNYYHILCLLKSTQRETEKRIQSSQARIGSLRNEIKALIKQTNSKKQQIENRKTLKHNARKSYENAGILRKLDKWISYHYTSWSKNGEISRLEKEIAQIEYKEIPERETQISGLKDGINDLESWLGRIKEEISNLNLLRRP